MAAPITSRHNVPLLSYTPALREAASDSADYRGLRSGNGASEG
jgi:hypothetical protein